MRNSRGIGGKRDYTRSEWEKAYRLMRVVGENLTVDQVVNLDNLHTMAYYRMKSREIPDMLSVSLEARLESKRIIEEILKGWNS